jgi:hypothetical protein
MKATLLDTSLFVAVIYVAVFAMQGFSFVSQPGATWWQFFEERGPFWFVLWVATVGLLLALQLIFALVDTVF